MPRSIDATLKSAMSSGSYTAYFLITIREVGHSIVDTKTPLYYKLTPTNLFVKFARSSNLMYGWDPGDLEMKLTRGVTVNGVNYTLDSSYFYITDSSWDGTYQYLEGCLLPEFYFTTAGDDTYENVITTVCSYYGKTAVFKRPAEAWLDYQFLPDGRTLVLPKASNLFNMLRQKYLIYACDNGNDEILFDAVAISRTYTEDHHVNIYSYVYHDFKFEKQFLSRDENATTHVSGPTTAPYHNLGYLESTDSQPDVTWSGRKHDFELLPVNLEYLTFDRFHITFPNLSSYVFNSQVIEVLDTSRKNMAWHIDLENFHWAESTEGGTMPSTIEAAAPYTPLNTSLFNTLLSEEDNNIQAAMDTLDDHVHDDLYRTQLTKSLDYYVRTDGSDSNDGSADDASHAFLTIQHAVNVAVQWDFNNWTVYIHVADGTYTIDDPIAISYWLGGGQLYIIGNATTPEDCIITGDTGYALFVDFVHLTHVVLEGFKFVASGSTFVGVACSGKCIVDILNCEFSTGFWCHIAPMDGSRVNLTGPILISDDAGCFAYLAKQSTLLFTPGITVTLSGTPNFTDAFLYVQELSLVNAITITFSGSATGYRYACFTNSVINTSGGGATYLPGDTVGYAPSGGQYV